VVVFSPHPDDETLGCGSTIIKKKRLGADVTIVFMTDGSKSHPHFIFRELIETNTGK
jgi:LmbE family N-acetylglucosaminyl deacetylase